MSSVHPARVSEGEFLALPESLDKVELIDGEVIVSPSPSAAHQLLVQRVLYSLMEWARRQAKPVTVGQAPWDVRFARGRILQPDVFLVFAQVPMDHEGPLDRVPELCVEVLSRNRSHDRLTKRFVYAEAGVQEYWIVDRTLVERWSGPALAETEDLRDVLRTPLLPDFELDLHALLA